MRGLKKQLFKKQNPFLACTVLGGELVCRARLPESRLTVCEETVCECLDSLNLVRLFVGLGLS